MKRMVMFLMTLMFIGCASTAKIARDFSSIDYSDGISAIEAKRIAQKYLMSHPSGNHFGISTVEMYWDIGGRYKELAQSAWLIDFPSKEFMPLSPYFQAMCIVAVDKKTGNLRLFAVDKGGAYVEFESYGAEGIKVQ